MQLSRTQFDLLLSKPEPDPTLSIYLRALWFDKRGAWEQAHTLVQELDDSQAARIHAYLHRREGDLANAAYWYRRAGCAAATCSLDEEWEQLLENCLPGE